jgi:hypothetical protein
MALAVPFSLWGMIMEKEERKARMNELLDKDNFDYKDYLELKNLIDEDEKEYYDMKDKFMKAVYGMK